MKDVSENRKFIRSLGLRFAAEPAAQSRRRRTLLKRNAYCRTQTDALLRNVDPSDTVIELGAGFGYISTLIAAKLGVRRIHAFEANPHMIRHIKATHAANGIETVEVVNAILGPRKGMADFFVRGDFAASSIFPDRNGPPDDVIAVERIDMLDAQTVFDRIHPSVLVCDIVGAEADLLTQADLSGLRLAVVELYPKRIGSAGVKAVFGAMAAAGLIYFPKASRANVLTFRRDW